MKFYASNLKAILSDKHYGINSILSVVFIFLLFGCSESIEQESQLASKPVKSADIQLFSKSHSYQVTRQYVGKVKAKQHSLLGFEVSGKVISVIADVGDRVSKGDILASLDVERLTIKQQELTANLQQISAQKLLNKANLKRQKSLIAQGYTSAQRIDELTAEKSILAANAQTIRATMASIDYQIKHSELIAPFNGIVSLRHISQGDVIEAGKPVVNIFTQKNNEIHVGVPAFVAKRLQKDVPITVTIAGQLIDTSIIAISKHVDTSTQTVQIRLALAQNFDAYNEQLVKVAIDIATEADGFWIPLSALTDGIRGQWNILTAIKDESAKNKVAQYLLEKETVKVLFSNEEQAYISGLPEQRLSVVASGVHRFVAKQTVIAATPLKPASSNLQGIK
jgi:RND family efflux transporter MFP subunit